MSSLEDWADFLEFSYAPLVLAQAEEAAKTSKDVEKVSEDLRRVTLMPAAPRYIPPALRNQNKTIKKTL